MLDNVGEALRKSHYDQAHYIYDRLWQSQEALSKTLQAPRYGNEGLVISCLEWLAQTLDSADAFLLSWPDTAGSMRIQKPAIIKTPGLDECERIAYLDRWYGWLCNEQDKHWVRNSTVDLPELYNIGIKSVIATKITTHEDKFRGQQLLLVCNRNKLAFDRQAYLGYDRWFCSIAAWMLELTMAENYHIHLERYENAKKRYSEDRIVSSLDLVGQMSLELLRFYHRYCANLDPSLIYDCLDSYITLYSAKSMRGEALKDVLAECKQYWLEETQAVSHEGWDPVHCALARGYLALGITFPESWAEAKNLLARESIDKDGNESEGDIHF